MPTSAVLSGDYQRPLPEMGHQAFAFFGTHGDAFEVVVRHGLGDEARVEVVAPHPAFLTGHRRAGMVATLRIDRQSAERAVRRGYLLATDLADYLVGKGAAFRTAHEAVARLVNHATGEGKALPDLTLEEYRRFSPLFGEDVRDVTVESSLAARDNVGGTAPRRVAKALQRAREMLGEEGNEE